MEKTYDDDEIEIDLLELLGSFDVRYGLYWESLYCLGVYQVRSVHLCSLPSMNRLQWFIFFQRRRH